MNLRGMTLPELIIAAAILALAIGGILFSYLTCLDLVEISKNSSLALHTAKAKMEQIKSSPSFAQIEASYDGVSFERAGFEGKGVSYVDDANPSVLIVTVSFSWRQKNGRVIGEDKDLDGQLDAGEDKNGNNRLDSIVELTSAIYNR